LGDQLEESFDSDRNIVRIRRFRNGSSDNLSKGLINSVECRAKQYLIYKLTAVNVVANEDLGPQLWLATFDEIAGLLLEHRVVVGDSNKLIVAESFGVRDVRQVRVPCFAELSDDEGSYN